MSSSCLRSLSMPVSFSTTNLVHRHETGGRAVEKMKLLALFVRNFFRVADVAVNAPVEAAALPNVPIIMSI